MAFWTYMLRRSDRLYYTGRTEDLKVRLAQHRRGYFHDCCTYKRRPVELIRCEPFPTRCEALEAERRVGGRSRAKKEALIRGDRSLVSVVARPLKEGQAEKQH
jgi:predicted GIY-YIG superfamily endonuclease